MNNLTTAQYEQLLKPINPSRVKSLDGMHHLEAWDVRAHLIRIFGFGGFSVELLECTHVYEQDTTTRAGKNAYKVGYRATVRLTIHATNAVFTEAAFGESVMPDFKRGDAHDMAIKTAESQALKRAATNLGTQFGLSLYNDGALVDVVRATLISPDEDTHESTPPAPEVPSVASAEQLATIQTLQDQMGFDDEVFLKGVRDAVKDPAITSITALTSEQADTLIARLGKAVEAKRAA